VLLLVLAFFSIFFRLGGAPMQRWDEARLALNAAELLENKQWLVTTYHNQPDLWNTKPPLMIWLQALSMRALGYSELAVRLPAALAALATVLLVFFASSRPTRIPLVGWLAAVILLSSPGFVTLHVARTGDYDALLVLWTTLGLLAFYHYFTTESKRALWLTGAAFTLAVLTKGVAGLLGLPALAIAAASSGQLRPLLRQRSFWLVMACSTLAVGSYYVARELAAPGYLQAVWENELGGRALHDLEAHHESLVWYWNLVAEKKFSCWLALAVVGLLLSLRQPKSTPEHRLALLAGLWSAWYLVLLSVIQTKLTWYDAPIYPALSLIAALGVVLLARAAAAQFRLPSFKPVWLVLGSLLLFWGPYSQLMGQLVLAHRQRYSESGVQFGRYLQAQREAQPGITTYTVLDPTFYNGSMEWYAKVAQTVHGQQVAQRPSDQLAQFTAGETLVICDGHLRRQLQQQRHVQVLWQLDSCATLRILP